jgi:diguanylate cyclase
LNYTESREHSAEILRVVLGHLGRHDAAFNPVSFALWYEYVAGINVPLAQALDPLLKTGVRLTDALVMQLFRAYIAPVDQQAVEQISGQFVRAMADMASSASRTGDDAGRFGAQLDGLELALKSAVGEGLAPHVQQALKDTAGMRNSAQALQQQVLASGLKIEKLQAELGRVRDEALLDPLTRVLNRRGFDQHLSALLRQPQASGRSHCLIMIDIDHFKSVNDTHGHVTGDRVIQGMGEILRACGPTPACSVARYGGEEFAILVPDTTLEQSTALAESVLQRTKAMKIRNRKTQEVLLTVTVSAGVACMDPGDDADSLIARADAALYQSKQAGRDRVTCARVRGALAR